MSLLGNRDKLGSMLLLIFSLFYLRYIFDIPLDPTAGDEFFTPRTLPKGLAVLTIICSLIQLFMPVADEVEASVANAIKGFRWTPMLLLTVLMLAYSLSFNFLGFIPATFLFLVAGFTILGEKRYGLSCAIAGGLVFFMWAVLTQLFNLYLDTGTLYRLMTGAI